MDHRCLAEELENVNILDLLTPNEVLDAVKMYDSTVDIIDYVGGIESLRLLDNKQQYKFLKFFLNNGDGKGVQVVAWNDEIKSIEHHIRSNYIIHLNGVQARPPKNAKFNNGNVHYELQIPRQIRSNSVINNLGKYEPTEIEKRPTPVMIADALNYSDVIGCGAITDGLYKLEVHVLNFIKEEYLQLEIKMGDKLKLIGTMYTKVDPPYLLVKDIGDIEKLNERLVFPLLIKGTLTLEKRKIEDLPEQNEIKGELSYIFVLSRFV